MTIDEFRHEMNSFRQSVSDEAISSKQSQLALERLFALYESFDEGERFLADQVIREWVLSDNEGVRFDAIALIRDMKLLNAVPELRLLAARLASDISPGGPNELEKVHRLIAELR